ncbi:hypothetical protein LCGC14_0801040 [marine sediment metagenome]|uniref:Uncharacterized protein n=1 Tax=marine sediment metagenome TaxID=412755 RepID=A0A0F9SWP5_9ZZZZ
MSSSLELDQLITRERQRRERRNLRDRLARSFLKEHPEVVDNPEMEIVDVVPEGTTEAAIRGIARHYHRMRKVREYLREIENIA